MLGKQDTEMVAGAAVSPKAAKAPIPKKDCKRQNTTKSSVKQSSLEMAHEEDQNFGDLNRHADIEGELCHRLPALHKGL